MTVTANGMVDLTSACVEIAQNITMTASGTGFVCATDVIINLGSAEIRNDFGKTGTITATACGGVGRIEIGNAILVDNGKSGGGYDPEQGVEPERLAGDAAGQLRELRRSRRARRVRWTRRTTL